MNSNALDFSRPVSVTSILDLPIVLTQPKPGSGEIRIRHRQMWLPFFFSTGFVNGAPVPDIWMDNAVFIPFPFDRSLKTREWQVIWNRHNAANLIKGAYHKKRRQKKLLTMLLCLRSTFTRYDVPSHLIITIQDILKKR